MSASPPKASRKRLPSLDGWRAICIFIVLGTHTRLTYDFPPHFFRIMTALFPGYPAVRCFFVISGFLITRLLIDEHLQAGKISLRRFYMRRALRILPVYFAFLAVLAVLQATTPLHQNADIWWGDLTFTVNFHEPPYFSAHLWSLAVEEQFYLLWPPLLVLIGCGNTRRLLQWCGAAALIPSLMRFIQYTWGASIPKAYSPFFNQFSSFLNVDALAIGCAASLLYVEYKQDIERIFLRHRLVIFLVGLAFVFHWRLVPHAVTQTGFLICCSDLLTAMGMALLILQSVVTPQLYPMLNWQPVMALGVLSYSIYIWQMPFSDNPKVFELTHAWFLSYYLWYIPAIAMAMISYFCLEQPLLRWRARLRKGA